MEAAYKNQTENVAPCGVNLQLSSTHEYDLSHTVKPRIVRTIRSRNSAHNWGAHNGCLKKLSRFSLSVTDSYV